MRKNSKISLLAVALWAATSSCFAATTDISNLPLNTLNSVKPNLIFALDDSGSMDFEVLLNTNTGVLWWDGVSKSFTDGSGKPWFNTNGTYGPEGSNRTWYGYAYLFPNGKGDNDNRLYYDGIMGNYGIFAVPPTPDFAFMRSADYNPMYYNPSINYIPWSPAYFAGATRTYSNANPSSAPSHPLYTTTLLNLTTPVNSQSSNWTFRMLPGMVIPGSTISGIKARKNGANNFQNITTNYTIANNEYWDVAIPYYPATYYVKDPTCTNGTQCFSAPDGARLRRYEIKSGNTFPSGRSYAAELQNFANWFTYYRKHQSMLASAMSSIIPQVSGMRTGIVLLNNLSPVTMYDLDNSNNSQNGKALLGVIYQNVSINGTPTRDALQYIGEQYRKNNNIIQYACQYNAAMVLTDGYADISSPTVPTYNSSIWGSGSPYTTIYPKTLADLALAYFTLNLRPDLPTGLVPINTANNSPGADKNPNLHMATYALSLATAGTIYGTGTPQANNPYQNAPNWPNPTVNYSQTAVDDLWHATINGRGSIFAANNTSSIISSLQSLINNVFTQANSASSATIADVNITSTNNKVYIASYSGNYGDLQPYTIDLSTGQISNNQIWSASDELDTRDLNSRVIATYNGSAGIPFQWANLTASMQNQLNSLTSPPGPSDGQNVLAWIRGERNQENVSYRFRAHRLGDIVNADPVPVSGAIAAYTDAGYGSFSNAVSNRNPMIYQAANDGMLHAFDATTGIEKWAYIPNLVFSNLDLLASKTYSHFFTVDGTPTVGDVPDSANNWRTLLIGGLRAGGKGYYALNITDPAAMSDNDVAAKVLWEFPNTNTAAAIKANIGLSFGKPIIAKTKAAGWVALVTSGYNNTTGDGKGHLFVLNPFTGAVIADLVTTAGTQTSPSGLAQISAFAYNGQYDPTIDYVYGGDLQGNVWRFDLSSDTISSWNVALLATLVDSSGNPQPITTAPEMSESNNRRIIYVGTGKLLGASDLTNNQTQSMYALVDNKSSAPTITAVRSRLKQKVITGFTIDGSTVDYATYRGWFFDLPAAGERINMDPVLVKNVLVFNTNKPSAIACSASSYEYIVDASTGGQIPGAVYNGSLASIVPIATSFTSKPLVVVLPNGQIQSIIHNNDNSLSTIALPSTTINTTAKTIAWQEILKE